MAELVDALLSDGSVFTCEFESHQLHILIGNIQIIIKKEKIGKKDTNEKII